MRTCNISSLVARLRADFEGSRQLACFAPSELNVGFGSISTESELSGHIRFTPSSDHTADIPERQLRARIGRALQAGL
jgi:hypothetical protein